jgi:drug/metabolite transporter (DMT)-like permease
MAAVLALLASLTWGTADFLGGTAARRMRPTTVVAVSQAWALLGVAVVAAATAAWRDPAGYLGWSLLAAGFGVVALTAFYAALAVGRMGVVAPIAALGVAVPVAVGLAQGEHPSAWQGVGVVVAVGGVVLASGPEIGSGAAGRRPLLLAAVAAVGFGAVIVCVARGARSSTLMTLVTMRAASVAVLGIGALLGLVGSAVRARDHPMLAAVGAGDVGANALFAVASTRGSLAMVSVLASLYPAVTAVWARVVHGEELRRLQQLGVVAALAGVALIASGGV